MSKDYNIPSATLSDIMMLNESELMQESTSSPRFERLPTSNDTGETLSFLQAFKTPSESGNLRYFSFGDEEDAVSSSSRKRFSRPKEAVVDPDLLVIFSFFQ